MKMIHKIKWMAVIALAVFFIACNNGNDKAAVMYTCPMPQDSVFSDKPGKCPKCGMDLVLMENHLMHSGNETSDSSMAMTKGYTCPMHPKVQSDTAGTCPVCGMQLEKVKSPNEPNAVSLNTLLKPSNQQVIANVPMVHMMAREEDIEMESYGFITYDTR